MHLMRGKHERGWGWKDLWFGLCRTSFRFCPISAWFDFISAYLGFETHFFRLNLIVPKMPFHRDHKINRIKKKKVILYIPRYQRGGEAAGGGWTITAAVTTSSGPVEQMLPWERGSRCCCCCCCNKRQDASWITNRDAGRMRTGLRLL